MADKISVGDVISLIQLLTQPPGPGDTASLKPGVNPFDWQLEVNLEKLESVLKSQGKYANLLKQIEAEKCAWDAAGSDVRWRFVVIGLRCLLVLKDETDAAVTEFKKKQTLDAQNKNIGKDAAAPPMSPDTFSFAQNKAISTLVQFIVCLGICPCLLPGVGLPLERRSGFAASLQTTAPPAAPASQNKRLAHCVQVLLKCSKQAGLGGLILSRHLGDLLAALFQMCYSQYHTKSSESSSLKSSAAEVNVAKKTDAAQVPGEVTNLPGDASVSSPIDGAKTNAVDAGKKPPKADITSCASNSETSSKDAETSTACIQTSNENELSPHGADPYVTIGGESGSARAVSEQDGLRRELQQLLQHVYQPLLVKELLILQGGPAPSLPRPPTAGQPAAPRPQSSQAKTKAAANLPRAPNWLRKTCGRVLSEILMRRHGVQNLLRGMLDGSTDSIKPGQTPDWSKCDAVAHIIANCPLIAPSLQSYYSNIGRQLMELLHVGDKLVARQFTRVAVTTINVMLVKNAELTRSCILKPLLQPLLTCLEDQEIDRNPSVQVLTSESELSRCIEDIHILVVSSEPQSRLMSALTSVLHPLFLLFCFSSGGITHLRSQCELILRSLLTSGSNETALSYLRLMAFDQQIKDQKPPVFRMHRHTDFAYGDDGGLEIIVASIDSEGGSWESWDVRASCIVDLLTTLKKEEIVAEFFVSMLKELTQMISHQLREDRGELSDGERKPETLFEMEKQHEEAVERFRSNMMVLNVLANLSETLGPECFKNVLHILDFVEATLEHAVLVLDNTEDATFGAFESETLTMAMGLLTAIIGGAMELSRDDRYAMTRILPILHKIGESHPDATIKLLATDLRIAIATLGHVKLESLSQRYTPKSKTTEQKQQPPSESQQPKIEVLSSVENDDKKSSPVIKKESKETCELKPVSSGREKDLLSNTDQKKDVISARQQLSSGTNASCDSPFTADSQKNAASDIEQNSVASVRPMDLSPNSPDPVESRCSDAVVDEEAQSAFKQAYTELHDALLPVRGHGLIALRRLVEKRDEVTLANFDLLLKEGIECLSDEDTYIYLGAISLLAALGELRPKQLMPTLLQHYTISQGQGQKRSVEFRMKLGEVIMKTFRSLGDTMPAYRDQVLSVLMVSARDEDPLVRSSSISNLGEMCKLLRFSLGNIIHEVLNCVSGLLKGDSDVEVRKSAAMFITLLLQGLGDDTLKVLEESIQEVYRLMKHVVLTEKDETVCFHIQMALQELDDIMKRYMFPEQTFTKRIHVLDPL